jgi:pimeloyl-ACP methyl ester carboxylesterase
VLFVCPLRLADCEQGRAQAFRLASLHPGPARLAEVRVPTLVAWGDSDGIAGPEYGRAVADAIPGARFELLADTGHLPQLESPDKLLSVLQDFAGANSPA